MEGLITKISELDLPAMNSTALLRPFRPGKNADGNGVNGGDQKVLNIEAAGVGEDGRGFMVVASEMSKSANYVRQVIDEISQIISAIGQTSNKIDFPC